MKSIDAASAGFNVTMGDGNWTMENLYWNLYGSPDRAVVPYVLNFMACFYAFLFSMFLITLPTRQLVVFYAYLAAAAAIPISYFSHYIMTDTLANVRLGQGRSTQFIKLLIE
jgi:hypothetical protein